MNFREGLAAVWLLPPVTESVTGNSWVPLENSCRVRSPCCEASFSRDSCNRVILGDGLWETQLGGARRGATCVALLHRSTEAFLRCVFSVFEFKGLSVSETSSHDQYAQSFKCWQIVRHQSFLGCAPKGCTTSSTFLSCFLCGRCEIGVWFFDYRVVSISRCLLTVFGQDWNEYFPPVWNCRSCGPNVHSSVGSVRFTPHPWFRPADTFEDPGFLLGQQDGLTSILLPAAQNWENVFCCRSQSLPEVPLHSPSVLFEN